jgi:hypothetical protein
MIILLFNTKLTLKIMRMIKQVNLYSTSHCHLCELAGDILLHMKDLVAVNIIEIAYDDVLLASYGTRIPVLQRQDTKAELNWPFSSADIAEFLN